MRIGVVVASGLAALALVAPARAHRGHSGLTVIEIDAASGAVTVVHRFAAHDVEPVLPVVAPEAQPSLDDPEAVAALEDHLDRRLRLEVNDERIDLDHRATELAGDQVRVDYAGARTPEPGVRSVTVDLDFFPGVYDDQEQQVNIRSAGVTRTVVFRPGSAAQTVEFAN